jgi:hypothetical protein
MHVRVLNAMIMYYENLIVGILDLYYYLFSVLRYSRSNFFSISLHCTNKVSAG